MTAALARICLGRVHYAWVALIVAFTITLGAVGVRAAPGVIIVPLQHAFGWSVGTISAAISLNILLLGMTGPFITGLMETLGLRRTILLCLVLLLAGHRTFDVHHCSVAVVLYLGPAGRRRRQRWRGRHGGGGGEPLVRGASRPGDGTAQFGQRRGTVDLPADARTVVAGLWLAERVASR